MSAKLYIAGANRHGAGDVATEGVQPAVRAEGCREGRRASARNPSTSASPGRRRRPGDGAAVEVGAAEHVQLAVCARGGRGVDPAVEAGHSGRPVIGGRVVDLGDRRRARPGRTGRAARRRRSGCRPWPPPGPSPGSASWPALSSGSSPAGRRRSRGGRSGSPCCHPDPVTRRPGAIGGFWSRVQVLVPTAYRSSPQHGDAVGDSPLDEVQVAIGAPGEAGARAQDDDRRRRHRRERWVVGL